MAYVEYVACDRCGKDMGGWTDQSVGITYARKYARKMGWRVGKAGWICPACRRKVRETPSYKRDKK